MADAEAVGAPQGPVFTPINVGAPVIIDDFSMEDLIERLKLLNYEQDFCQNFGKGSQFKPLTKTYFTLPSDNPNAQFFLLYLVGHVASIFVRSQHCGTWSI
eukprot:PhF_6_TR34988/c0_g1_i1/m.50836